MKIAELPYYVEFVFNSSNGDCLSTADPELMQFIKQGDSNDQAHKFQVGDVIRFDPEGKKYKIKEIIIRFLFDDTELMKYGFDLEGCVETQGKKKETLFGVLLKMDPA